MVRLGKPEREGVGYKNGCILGTIGSIYFKLGQCIHEGMPYHQVALFSW